MSAPHPVTLVVQDVADPARAVPLVVHLGAHGVDVQAVNHQGVVVAAVMIELYHDALRVLVFDERDENNPAAEVQLVRDAVLTYRTPFDAAGGRLPPVPEGALPPHPPRPAGWVPDLVVEAAGGRPARVFANLPFPVTVVTLDPAGGPARAVPVVPGRDMPPAVARAANTAEGL